MTNQTAKQALPKFKTEAQERAHWESHDSAVHLDWSQAQKLGCPICGPHARQRPSANRPKHPTPSQPRAGFFLRATGFHRMPLGAAV